MFKIEILKKSKSENFENHEAIFKNHEHFL
jgi:hypothetical protein